MKLPCRWLVTLSLGVVLYAPSEGTAQPDPATEEHPLHGLAFLEGSWEGEIDGTLGTATGERQYRFILHDRFLLMEHDRDPGEPVGGSEAHEEWSIFSFDADREAIVLREFLVEGFVNRYVCELQADPARLTCESEAAEGNPELTLSLRYEFGDRDHFEEFFQVRAPDGALQVRMQGRWQRRGEG